LFLLSAHRIEFWYVSKLRDLPHEVRQLALDLFEPRSILLGCVLSRSHVLADDLGRALCGLDDALGSQDLVADRTAASLVCFFLVAIKTLSSGTKSPRCVS